MNTFRTYTLDLCIGGTPISSEYVTTSDKAYGPNNAFDNSESTDWQSNCFCHESSHHNVYIGYIFTSPKKIAKIRYLTDYFLATPRSIYAQASNDGTNWLTIQQFDDVPIVEESWIDLVITVPPTIGYTHWRLLCNYDFIFGFGWTVKEIEMMECVDTNIPIIDVIGPKINVTENCFLGAVTSSGDYSKFSCKENCFKNDGNMSYWQSALKGEELIHRAYIGYRFFNPLRVGKIRMLPISADTNVTSLRIQAGNDVGYDTIQRFDNIVTVPGQWIDLLITAPKSYYTTFKDWILLAHSTTKNGYWQVGEIEFYGVEEALSTSCMIISK